MTGDPSSPASWFVGGGEMGAIMRSTDWSKTKLGPVEDWPRSLRTMLGVVLGSRFPMLLWWGPDLLHLYNDAYRPILRDKHPASLAAPASQVWAEVWDVAGPMMTSVQKGGPATWTEDLQLFINSGGMLEETYFTFSYSPVPGDDGKVGGVLNTVQETTAKVQGERQSRMLYELSARAAEAKSEDDAYRMALEALSSNELDVPFALLYVLKEKSDQAQLVGAIGLQGYEGEAKAIHVPITEEARTDRWPLAEALRTGSHVVVDDLSARLGPLPMGSWNGRPERAIVLPLSRPGLTTSHAFLVAGISPHRVLNDAYQRFYRATADHVMVILANARAFEEEKRRSDALAEIDRAKTAFFSNVSHEFRTPLTLILGPIENALARGSLAGEDLEAVHRSALRLLRLVNSLLDFSRVEAGRMNASFEPTDVAALTVSLAGSFRSLIESSGLRLVVECPPVGQPVYVDRSQWEKIVLNLLSNAFKFTFEGAIAVRLRTLGKDVELSVSDSGVGIPEGELDRVFERFHRVEVSRGRSFEGTGIGLALVAELVRTHGGQVRVESTVGQGSTFFVSIPLGSAHLPSEQVASETTDDHRDAKTSTIASAMFEEASRWLEAGNVERRVAVPANSRLSAPPPSGRKSPRILIADDNADMRGYLQRLLEPHWEVEVVEDGRAALASALARPPALVLSDIMMPRMDGVALLRALRADPQTASIPVVLLSARAGEEEVLQGLDTGADDYLVKPFSARELVTRIRTHLGMARTRIRLLRDLERKNKELEAFSYSVSHDLRAPLRSIDGFSLALLEDHAGELGAQGREYLLRVRTATQRMNELIDDLLKLSRVERAELLRGPVDLSRVALDVAGGLAKTDPTRVVRVTIQPEVAAFADSRLLRIVLENLLGNAWKFTSKTSSAEIEFGASVESDKTTFFVRDNGAGFPQELVGKLFGAFQRLHSQAEFPGTGVGLATVQRIVRRHDGEVWAEGSPEKGATFYWTLPAAEHS